VSAILLRNQALSFSPLPAQKNVYVAPLRATQNPKPRPRPVNFKLWPKAVHRTINHIPLNIPVFDIVSNDHVPPDMAIFEIGERPVASEQYGMPYPHRAAQDPFPGNQVGLT